MQALALLSGGLDSTVALWWALEQGHDVQALTVHYHKRPEGETEATRAIAEQAGVDLIEVDLPWLRELEHPRHPVLENEELEREHPRGYVPARNAIFYAIAAHHAEILGCEVIVAGHNGIDPDRFPDAAPGFLARLVDLLDEGLATRPGLSVELPMAGCSKTEVVERGRALGAPLEACWSCDKPHETPCGECPSCRARREAFARGDADGARAGR
jgi:7-cyano-7-deazaguanine synthase